MSDRIAAWLRQRLAEPLTTRVGHIDLLALYERRA